MKITSNTNRKIIEITGQDASNFLQGIITADIHAAQPYSNTNHLHHAIFSGLLSPKGKILADFLIINIQKESNDEPSYLIEVSSELADSLHKKFKIYALRAKIKLIIRDDLQVSPLWHFANHSSDQFPTELPKISAELLSHNLNHYIFQDPRFHYHSQRSNTPNHNYHLIYPQNINLAECLTKQNITTTSDDIDIADEQSWHSHLADNFITEIGRDLPVEEFFLLDVGYDLLDAVDFAKGCYVGQEVTARMKYKANRKKTIAKISDTSLTNRSFEVGEKIISKDNKKLGHILNSYGQFALAQLNIEAAQNASNENNIIHLNDDSKISFAMMIDI